ncbi:Cyclin-dependent kinase 11B [Parelaphostrongylus tenuis]|uniref:Cyclin-dependent kinase 11B n=1 Tax=Parelaphostrongylus tenuis TaxID=148309 RepID=A0AAD5MS25_PARTN|nr:Cyclin-dependent kinase 11B [Parelaphostrongylus tenuis]
MVILSGRTQLSVTLWYRAPELLLGQKELGTLSECIWDGYNDLPGPKMMNLDNFPHNQLWKKFPAAVMNESGFELLTSTLTYLSGGHNFRNPERAKLLADLKVRSDQVTSGAFSLKFDKTRF